LYNVVRGQLQNIPDVGTGAIYVSLYSGSLDNSSPTGSALQLVSDLHNVSSANNQVVTGGYIETGIYTASFALTAAASGQDDALTRLFDVWWKGDADAAAGVGTQFHTGTISPTTLDSLNIANTPRYTTKITNLKDSYADQENVRFRVYTRDRNWNPNIYKVASRDVENLIVEDAYYKILRVTDSEEVIGYGTGSTPGATGSASDYTRLSFDVSGSYFDLDMTLLESGYAYGVKFVYFVNGKYLEQPETFKFRVE
jgi:hypothetical protein